MQPEEKQKICSHCGKPETTYRLIRFGLHKDLCCWCGDELLNDDKGPDHYAERANRRLKEREE